MYPAGCPGALLNQDPPDDWRVDGLAAVHCRSLGLSRIVDRLRLSRRLEAGHRRVSLSQVDLGPLIAERSQALEAVTGRMIVVEGPDDLQTVFGDSTALVTIIEHLVENAIKYSPGGEPVRVSVTFDHTDVYLAIADEGVGMDAEQLAHCFEKFWQAETTDVRRFGGTGIGLFIVQSLVEAMGARIDVTSELGQGTRFVVSVHRHAEPVPVAPDETSQDGAKQFDGGRSMIHEFTKQIGGPARPDA